MSSRRDVPRPQRILGATLLLWLPAALAAEPAPLGRLFFTPAQRQALDMHRSAPSPRQGEEGSVTLDGHVSRSSGQRTLWLNGTPRDAADLPPGMSAAADGLRLPGKGRMPRLRPGETLDPASGTLRPLLPAGALAQPTTRP